MKRARADDAAASPPGPAPAPPGADADNTLAAPPLAPAPAPAFVWAESYGSRVILARADAARGGGAPHSLLAAPSLPPDALSALHALAAPFGYTADPGGGVRRSVWLPPALGKPAVSVAFPSVRLGNRLFIWCTARVAAALLGRDFHLLTPDASLAGLPERAAACPLLLAPAPGGGGGGGAWVV